MKNTFNQINSNMNETSISRGKTCFKELWENVIYIK